MTAISVIIPAFKAHDHLPRALKSIAAQGISADDLEVVIAPDDGGDYSFARGFWPRVSFAASFQRATGPGAARNRAMAAARGRYFAYLDADDAWGEGYLKALLPLSRRHGLAFAPTQVFSASGAKLMTLGPTMGGPTMGGATMGGATMGAGHRQLTLADFGHWPGSFHPLLHRDLTPGFDHGAGQDVVHAMAVLGLAGGRAPLAPSTAYHLHLSGGSVTAAPAFARRIDRRYQQMIKACQRQRGFPRHRPPVCAEGMDRLAAIHAFEARRRWNRIYLEAGGHADGFYGMLAQNIKK